MNKKIYLAVLVLAVVIGGVALLNKTGNNPSVNNAAAAALYTPNSNCDTNIIRLNGGPTQYVHLVANVPQTITFDFSNCPNTSSYIFHNLSISALKIRNNGGDSSLPNNAPLTVSALNTATGQTFNQTPGTFTMALGEVPSPTKIQVTLKTTSGPALDVGLRGTYYFGGQ